MRPDRVLPRGVLELGCNDDRGRPHRARRAYAPGVPAGTYFIRVETRARTSGLTAVKVTFARQRQLLGRDPGAVLSSTPHDGRATAEVAKPDERPDAGRRRRWLTATITLVCTLFDGEPDDLRRRSVSNYDSKIGVHRTRLAACVTVQDDVQSSPSSKVVRAVAVSSTT
jgi:hypothetical protein